jgi:predicted MFS family arabinose efflux permease
VVPALQAIAEFIAPALCSLGARCGLALLGGPLARFMIVLHDLQRRIARACREFLVPYNRWIALALIFLARLALAFQFQSVGSVAPFLVHDFGIGFVQVGTLVGLYLLPGAFIAVPGGMVGRRFGDKRVVLVGLVLMIAGGIVAGAAPTYGSMVAGRLLSGVGACFVNVLVAKMIADWFADKELVFAMSINIIGWPLGIAAGQAVQAGIAEGYSWQSVFYLTSAVLALCLLAMAALYQSPGGATRLSGEKQDLGGRELWMVCLAGAVWMIANAAYLVVLTFGPTLLTEHGVSISNAAFTVSLMSWISLAALPLGAYLATRYRIADLLMIAGLVGCAATALVIPFALDAANWLFIVVGFTFSLAMPVISSLPAQLLAQQNRALGFGVYYVWFYAGTPFLTAGGGWLKDRFGSAEFSVFYAAGLIVLSLGLVVWVRYQQTEFSEGRQRPGKAAAT